MAHEGHDHDHDHDHDHVHHHHHDHGPHGHHAHAHTPHADRPFSPVSCAVLTCSDSRTAATDEGGPLAARLLEDAGHTVTHRSLVKDEPQAILAVLDEALGAGARAVIFTGGTGLSSRDVTVDAVAPRFTRTLDGFGELFRSLSFAQVGPVAFASRATAGVIGRSLVFVLPGAPGAVKLAVERLIAPALSHLVHELSR